MKHSYRNGRTRQAVSLLLIFQLVFSPLYSSIALAGALTVDSNAAPAHQPTFDSAGNGVPIVQITAPSASGVSLNKYGQLNIDSNGLILNNSQLITKTQLGGYIEGNTNLQNSNGASIIVNQVNGGLPSALNGYAEVAGQQAEVIIANPGGITCNGCGFINTNRGVLTTGTVVLDGAGAVDNISVNQGVLQVNGKGLNASNIDQLDLLARAIEVNAEIHGKQLNVLTGTQRVNYRDLTTSAIDGKGEAPSLSLDVSALGGMYANRIFMVGTEKGVGVNSEGIITAGAGGLILTAEGNIRLKNTQSGVTTSLTSTSGNIELVGDHFSQQTMSLTADEEVNIAGVVGAKEVVTVSSRLLSIDDSGTLYAGYDKSGLISEDGVLDINTDSMLNKGAITSQHISVTAHQLENIGGVNQVGEGEFNIAADVQVVNRGILSASDRLSINSARYDNNDGIAVSGGALDVNAADISNLNGAIQSNELLSVTANVIDNRHGVLVGGNGVNLVATDVINEFGQLQTGSTLKLTSETLDNQNGTVLVLSDADQEITLKTMDNRDGEFETNAKNLVLNVTRLDNSAGGNITHFGDQTTTIKGSELNNQNGIINSNGLINITEDSLVNNNDGQLSAVKNMLLSVAAGDVYNDSGLIESGGLLDISASIISNYDGKISSQQVQNLTAGSINNQLGAVESAATLYLNATSLDNRKGSLISLSSSDQTLDIEHIDNRDGSLASNANNWLIDANTLDNTSGGRISHHGAGMVTINASTNNNSGAIKSNGSLTLNQKGVFDNRAGLVSAVSDLTINSSEINNQSGQILANNHLNISADHFSFEGRIDAGYIDISSHNDINITAGRLWNTAGNLKLTAAGHLALEGEINTGGHYELAAHDMTIGSAGTLAGNSFGQVSVSDTFTNHNRISAKQDLSVFASELYNYGDLGGLTTLLDVGSIYNTGLLFGQNQLNVYSDRLYNHQGDMFTFGDMVLAKDSALNKSLDIVNDHGLIQSQGNLRFSSRSLRNEGSYTLVAPVAVSDPIVYNPYAACFENPMICMGEGVRATKTSITRYVPSATNMQTAKIIAGGSLIGNADQLKNNVSYIGAAGNIVLSGIDLFNTAGTATQGAHTTVEDRWWYKKSTFRGHKNRLDGSSRSFKSSETVTVAPTIIESQGRVNINFTGGVNNGTVTKNIRSVAVTTVSSHQNNVKGSGTVTLIAPTASKLGSVTGAPSASTQTNTLSPLSHLMVLDPLLTPGFELPNNHGLFTVNTNPAHPYLVETNPLLTHYNNFTSSDYLLDRLEWDGDEYLRRIGDGFYEQTLIEDSLQAQTGSRYLDGLAGAEMFEQLMDNAVQTKEDLNLSVGVSLSKDQVNRLTRSMIWMETRIVDGEKLLVPVVYLSSNRELKAENGALIAGKNVAILGNSDVVNTGVIEALDTLSISSVEGSVINRQGTLVAGNLLQIDAAKNIKNLSGRTEGQTLRLNAGDSIINETLIENVGSIKALAFSRQGARATLDAGQTLELNAGRNITDKAGSMTAGETLVLQAGEDISIKSQEQVTGYQFGGGSHYQALDRRDHLTSELHSGGDLTVMSGGNVLVEGASLAATNNVAIQAASNINLLAVANTEDKSFAYSRKDGLGGSDKSTTSESHSVTHQGASLLAGGELSIQSGENLLAYGSTLSADGDARIDAGNDIALIAAVDQESYAYQEKKENAVKFSHESQGFHRENALESKVSSGGSLSVNAEGNIQLLGSSLEADGDMAIGGTNLSKAGQASVSVTGGGADNVIVETVALNNEQWHKKSEGFKGPVKELIKAASIGFAAMMGGVIDAPAVELGHSEEQRTQQTTQSGSQLQAENLSIQSNGLTRLAGADIDVAHNMMVDAGDIQIDAVAETAEHYKSSTSETLKSLGMSLEKDELSLGGIQRTKEQQSQSVTTTHWKGTTLNAGNISLNADKNIDISTAQVVVENDLAINAGDSITVTGKQDQQTVTDKYSKETETITAGVRNAYVDTAYAVQAVADAEKALSKSRKALSEAKQKVKNGQLREQDLKYYEINLAAAVANLGQSTIQLAASATTAGGSTATAGFYATGSAQREKTETVTQTHTGEWNGSQLLVGGNASLSSGQQLAITGSDLFAKGTVELDSQTIQVTAGENTASNSSETNSDNQSVTASYGAMGLSGNGQVGYRNSESDSESLHYRNSQIAASTINSRSDALNVSGANLNADHINIETDTLVVESLQNSDQSNGKTRGGSVGAGFSGGGLSSVSVGIEQSDSESNRRWTDEQTQIIGRESVTISAKDTALTGAVIANATVDKQGQWVDQGNLSLNTETLTVNNLYDTDTAQSKGFSADVSINLGGTPSNEGQMTLPKNGQTTIGGHYNGHEKEQTTYATIGNGKIIVGGEAQANTAGLNRDVNNAQEITQDIEIGGLDASVTVDHRLVSEEGREDIANDVEQTLDLALAAGQAVVDGADFVHDEIQVLGTNLPEELSRLGETGERVIDELIRADLSQEEIDEIIAREKLQYAIEGVELGNQKLAENPELAQRHPDENSPTQPEEPPVNVISELSEPGELVIVVNGREPSGLEVGAAGLGKVKQEIDDLANTNPNAATALEYAIGLATGGPLKEGVGYAFSYGLEHVAGDQIQQVDEAINHAAGGYIRESDSETFSKSIASEKEYPDDNPVLGTSAVDISDGVRFAAGTILGIGAGSRKVDSSSQGSRTETNGQSGYTIEGNDGPDSNVTTSAGSTNTSNAGSSTNNAAVGGGDRVLWGSWNDYPKKSVDTPNGPQEYAVVGGRLYSEHAVARMQPSGQRYSSGPPAEGTAPPLTGNPQPYVNSPGIQNFDGNQNIRGRSISPNFVEDIIQNTKPIKQSNGNWNYRSGNLQVILSPDKKRVITVLDIH